MATPDVSDPVPPPPDAGVAVDLRLPAALQAAPVARAAVAAVAADPLPPHRVADAMLALTEAVTNAALHGEPADGAVHVRAWVSGGTLVVQVCDRGRGFDPQAGERGARTGLGLGLGLMRALADAAEIRARPGAGAQVLLAFRP